MDNNIDTNWYYVSYCLKGVRTFAKLRSIRIPAELGRKYLKGDDVTEELQEHIRNSTSREIADLNDIVILSAIKR